MCFCFFIDRRQQPTFFNIIFEILKWSVLIGLIASLVIASLKSTDDDSLILRLLRPLLIEGYRIGHKLITNPWFYTPMFVTVGVTAVIFIIMYIKEIFQAFVAIFYCVQGKAPPKKPDDEEIGSGQGQNSRNSSHDNDTENSQVPRLNYPRENDGREDALLHPNPSAPAPDGNTNFKAQPGGGFRSNSSSSGRGSINNSTHKSPLPGYGTVTGNRNHNNNNNNNNVSSQNHQSINPELNLQPNYQNNQANNPTRINNPLYGINDQTNGHGFGHRNPNASNQNQNMVMNNMSNMNNNRPSPSIMVHPNNNPYPNNQSNTLGRNNFANPYGNNMAGNPYNNSIRRKGPEKLLENY